MNSKICNNKKEDQAVPILPSRLDLNTSRLPGNGMNYNGRM